MENKALKILYTVFMAAILVALVVFAVIHIQNGLETQTEKIILGGYIILFIWAGYRTATLIRELIRK